MAKQPESVKDTISRSIGEAKEAPEEGKQIAQPQSQAKRENGEMALLDEKTLQNLVQGLVEWVEELDSIIKGLASDSVSHCKVHEIVKSRLDDHSDQLCDLRQQRIDGLDGGKSKLPTSHHVPPNSHNGLQETMAQLLAHISAPKEIVRDMNGRMVGIRPNKAFAAANGNMKDAASEEAPKP
jgi:hypothetical protein